MIGRATIGNPWIFREIKATLQDNGQVSLPTLEERCTICQRHIKASVAWKGEKRAINEMRKHYGAYFKGVPHFKEYKMQLMACQSADELYTVLTNIRSMP